MTRAGASGVLAVTLAAFAGCAHGPEDAGEDAAARAEIEAVLRGMEDAARARNPAGIVQADSLITIQAPDGSTNTTTAAELAEQQEQRWAAVLETRAIRFATDSVRVDGDSAVVYLRQRWERVVRRPDGDVVRLTRALHRETWIRRPEGWRTRYVVIVSQGPNCTNGVVDPPWAALSSEVACGPALIVDR